jgi:hypothetical protein
VISIRIVGGIIKGEKSRSIRITTIRQFFIGLHMCLRDPFIPRLI